MHRSELAVRSRIMEWWVVVVSIVLGAGTYGLYWLVDRLKGEP